MIPILHRRKWKLREVKHLPKITQVEQEETGIGIEFSLTLHLPS